MCPILVFNAINTIVTDMECNIRIDRLTLGRGTDHDFLDGGLLLTRKVMNQYFVVFQWKSLR